MTTTNPARRPSAPTPSLRPSAPMPPSPKPPANAPKTTTRCTASPACSRIWPPSASTTSNPPTTCRHSSNSPPPPRCNGEPSNSSASLTTSVTRRQHTPQQDHKTPGHTTHVTRPGGTTVYSARRTLHTGVDLLTDKQTDRLQALFAADEHAEVEATWGIYQRMIAAYRAPDRTKGKDLMRTLI